MRAAPWRTGRRVARSGKGRTSPSKSPAEWVTSKLERDTPRAPDRELVLFFPVDVDEMFETWADADVRFPFTVGADETSHDHEYQLFFADDFTSSTNSGGFTETVSGGCECGAELAYDAEAEYPGTLAAHGARRIRRFCLSCGARFDPGARSVSFQRSHSAAEERLRGGLTFRFALRSDCHKGWPRPSARLALEPEPPPSLACLHGAHAAEGRRCTPVQTFDGGSCTARLAHDEPEDRTVPFHAVSPQCLALRSGDARDDGWPEALRGSIVRADRDLPLPVMHRDQRGRGRACRRRRAGTDARRRARPC